MSLVSLQSRLKSIVLEEPLLAGVPVLIEEKGNLSSDLENALAATAVVVVIAPSRGQAKAEQAVSSLNSDESLEVDIHRGPLSDANAPSSVALLDALRVRIHGQFVNPAVPVGRRFRYLTHDLREFGDGTFVRVLMIGVTDVG